MFKSRLSVIAEPLLRQRGFTLIELVVVIVILGVLSAVAVPRFIDMGSDARAASVKALAGTLNSAVTQVNMLCRLTPACDPSLSYQSIPMKGRTYWLNYGYPDAGNELNTTQVDSIITYDGFIADMPTLSTTRFYPKGVKDPATCNVTYHDPYSGTAPGGVGKYGVVVNISDC